MNSQQRFELLSAYLDRELTAENTEKVEEWLTRDQQAQETYKNLLRLRYHIQRVPVYSSHHSSETLAKKVVSKANNKTLKQILFLGGGTMVALFITMMSGTFSWMNSSSTRLTRSDYSDLPSDTLTITLDQPVVEIPIAQVSTTVKESKKETASSSSPAP